MLYFLIGSGNLGTFGLNALGTRTIEQKLSTYNIPTIILILCPTHTCGSSTVCRIHA